MTGKESLVQHFAVILNGNFFHVADSPAGEDQLDVILADGQLDGVILDVDDSAIDAADGADTIAHLQRGQHILDLLILFPLGANQQEIENDEH